MKEKLYQVLDKLGKRLMDQQCQDGSWFGRWGIAFLYGTWGALLAYGAAGLREGERSRTAPHLPPGSKRQPPPPVHFVPSAQLSSVQLT